MMGYTHVIVGAASTLGIAALIGDTTQPETYIVASVAGALGGVSCDIDMKDVRKRPGDSNRKPEITDASRTRLATVGLIIVGALLGVIFQYKYVSNIIVDIHSGQYISVIGAGFFAIFMLLCYFVVKEHRGFTHSFLFILLSAAGICCVIPQATLFYIVGAVSHLVIDTLNYQTGKFGNRHGIWLFYPIRVGDGVAFGVCKSDRKGNKITYFTGSLLFLVLSGFLLWRIKDPTQMIAPIIIIVYCLVVLHLVRIKSEREIRHKMHINGEL